jgi:hypothetical protein
MRCRSLDLLHAISGEFELGCSGVTAILGPLSFACVSDLERGEYVWRSSYRGEL